jgi:hypothetical protein
LARSLSSLVKPERHLRYERSSLFSRAVIDDEKTFELIDARPKIAAEINIVENQIDRLKKLRHRLNNIEAMNRPGLNVIKLFAA